ncbi:amidohydrolase family protein [Microbacterium sp. P5_E9]
MADAVPPIIDAHVHLWDTSRFDLPWLAGVPELAPRYRVVDLQTAIGDRPVVQAVAVQAGESAEEAEWLFGEAGGQTALPFRVVLQYEAAAGTWLGRVQAAVDRLGIVPAGVRLPLHRRAAHWLDLDGLDSLLERLEEQGIVLELLLRPDQIAVVQQLAATHPRLEIVLCHLGLGALAPTPEWRTALARLSGSPHVSAKISGVFTRHETRSEADAAARGAIDAAVDALGPDRLMFGSDWPMSTRVGSYAEIIDRTAGALPVLTSSESAAIWRRTAQRIYGPA